MKKSYAVIGNPIAHSLSPQIHQAFANEFNIQLDYQKLLSTEEKFENVVKSFFQSGGAGLNVTAPFKELAYKLSDLRTARCEAAKSANTLWFEADKICADNTDGIGLVRNLSRYIHLEQQSLLILGAGGASLGIIDALLANNVTLTVVSRDQKKCTYLEKLFTTVTFTSYDDLNKKILHFDIIINTTSSLDQNYLADLKNHFKLRPLCYDLSYQLKTNFLTEAEAFGCQIFNGLGMLVEQAAEAFYVWHGLYPKCYKF